MRTFSSCPRKYSFQYLKGLGEIYKGDARMFSYSNLVHSALFDIYGDDPGKANVRKALSEAAASSGIRDNSMIDEARSAIEDYLKSSSSKGKVFRNNENMTVKWVQNEFFIHCDRIDISNDMLTVIDYKTGKSRLSADEAKEDIQNALYRILTEEKFKKPVKEIVLTNLTSRQEIRLRREELLPEDRAKGLVRTFIDDHNNMKKEGFKGIPGSQCKYCNFKIICPDADEDLKYSINYDPILGDIYRLNEKIRELSGILDENILHGKILEGFLALSGLPHAALVDPEKPSIKSGEKVFYINDGAANIAAVKAKGGDDIPFKKEAILESYLSQSAIFLHNARLYHKANTDRMTGFYHQSFLKNYIAGLIDAGSPFSLIMFDLDHFKSINDTYGHQTGDIVLIGFASLLKENIRLENEDIIARYGGEEFAVLLFEKNVRSAVSIADRVRVKLEKSTFRSVDGRTINITVSAGVNGYEPGKGSTALNVIEDCDKALYGAKETGRNRVHMNIEE